MITEISWAILLSEAKAAQIKETERSVTLMRPGVADWTYDSEGGV